MKDLFSADLREQFYEINRDSIWIAPVFIAFVEDKPTVVINEEHSEYRWCSAPDRLYSQGYPQVP